MSILVPINGVNYIIPTTNEVGWGSNLDAFFVAISAGTLQKNGGSFTLSAETDFGGAFGLKSLYYKSHTSNIATTGIVRLAESDSIAFGTSNYLLTTSSGNLTWRGNVIASSAGTVTSIIGTTNQVIVSSPTGNVTLSLPQSIAAISSPTFAQLTLNEPNVAKITIKPQGASTTTNSQIIVENTNSDGFTAQVYGTGNVFNINGRPAAGSSAIFTNTDLFIDTSTGKVISFGLNNLTEIAYLDSTGLHLPTSLEIASGGTAKSSFTPYAVLAGGTTSTGALQQVSGLGSSGQALVSNGAGALPTWQNVAGTGTVNSGTQFQLAYYATSTNTVSGLTLITASRALASDANGLPVASATTAAELAFVSGVTSAIQTQLNTKATDSLVVHLAGTEVITGAKTFSTIVSITGQSGNYALDINQAVAGVLKQRITNTSTGTTPSTTLELITTANNGALSGNSGILLQTKSDSDQVNQYQIECLPGTGSNIGQLRIAYIASGTQNIFDHNVSLGGYVTVGANGTPVRIKGSVSNDSAAAGFVGQIITSAVSQVSATTLTNSQYKDVTSITLTAGDWDISCLIGLTGGAVTGTIFYGGIGTVTGNDGTGLDVGNNAAQSPTMCTTASDNVLSVPPWRASLSGSTTYFLKAFCIFSGGTAKGYGRISARRVR